MFEIIFSAHDFQDPWGKKAYNSVCEKLRRNREISTLTLPLTMEEIDAVEERLKDDLNLTYFEDLQNNFCSREEFEGFKEISNSILLKISKPLWNVSNASTNY